MGRLPGDDRQKEMARNISGLPMRMGGLGLRSARRSAPAACWASWADCLSMLQKRLPEVTTHIMDQLAVGAGGQGCLGELCSASRRLDQSGFVARPDWTQLQEGLRPPQPVSSELGECASSPLKHHFRETMIFAQSDAADRAHLRSHAGPGASEVLLGAPTAMDFKVEPHLFRTLVLERLRLHLMMTEVSCECGARLDICGRHRGACARSGRLRARAVGPERSLARGCREAGATVRTNTLLRDMNLCVPTFDARAIEVLATGLPLHHGAQLAVDITLRSALGACGGARPNASHTDGAVLTVARRDKERKYHELLVSERCRLVVVAMETGGRWSNEATEFISCLAEAKAREAAPKSLATPFCLSF